MAIEVSSGARLASTYTVGVNWLEELFDENTAPGLGTGSIALTVDLEAGTESNDPERLRITVSDTGVGIAKADLTRIFEAVEQATTRAARTGMGLGLSIVANLAHGMGGELSVQSALQTGSVFTLSLPVERGQSLPEASGEMPGHTAPEVHFSGEEGHAEILVVDDDTRICNAVARIMDEAGFTTDQAATGEEALQKMGQHAYKLVLADIQLPGMSGIELAHIISLMAVAPPVIGMTANTEALKDGAHARLFLDWLNKPFDEDSLTRAVSRALKEG